MPRRVFITVAEVSGDLHAAQLIHSLRKLDAEMVIEGIGGSAMAAAGARLHHETVGRAAMTWRGALRAVEVWRLLRWTRNYFRTFRPDLQICVDSFAMNIHFAKAARASGVPVLMYVAPQLWAWREGRMKKLKRSVDRLACILPFEEGYFKSHGVAATFVGHPLFDELPVDRSAPRPSGAAPPVIGLLPGSRRSEAKHNFPHQLDVASRVLKEVPGASFLVPTTAATHPVVAPLAEAWKAEAPGRRLEYRADAFNDFVPRCDLCITVSGTATLHVAGFGTPMIVVYRVHPLTWHLAGRWLVRTRTFALVNVLAGNRPPAESTSTGRHIVPEIVPWYGSGEAVAKLAIELLGDPQKRDAQRKRLRDLVTSLDRPGASDNVARMAIEMIDAGKPISERGAQTMQR